MQQILIRNGIVFDPLNGVNGEVMDIGIKDGKIVDPSEVDTSRAYVIDAKGKVVMPGGIDIHSHIAGSKVNAGRLIRPEDLQMTKLPAKLPYRRSQIGRTVPNVFRIGYGYAELGYTLVAEPASPPLKTRHTHEELNAIPIIDKLAYIIVDSYWIVLDLIQEGAKEELAGFLAWLLRSTKGYALKLVDTGSDVAWVHGKTGLDIDEQIPGYSVTPRDVIKAIGEASELLNLPHQVHVHCNKLGHPGNYAITISTMNLAGSFARRGRPSMHITHVQFTGYKGDSWATLASGGEDIAKVLNANPHVTLDLGQIIPGSPATTMTGDAPFEFILYHLTGWKWSFVDVEAEGAAGIVPYRYRKKNYVNTVQWAIGLEVALLAKDVWRVYMTTDHPNGGPFTEYPKVVAWLVSKKAREETMKEMSQRGLKWTSLPAIDRELTLYDIAVMTRASPAKILGLEKFKGHLGVGADADVAIYDINPHEVDVSRDYAKLVKALRRAYCTIKGGEVVVKEGEVVKTTYGKTFYVSPEVPEDLLSNVESLVKEKFKRYYSVSVENYVITEAELRRPAEIKVRTGLSR